MSRYAMVRDHLRARPGCWLVTGAAGFIGSHLVEELLGLGQQVVGLDNFSTGHRSNLEQVRAAVGEPAWARFRLVEGDVGNAAVCRDALQGFGARSDHGSGVACVLHQAALGSVPRSIDDPLTSHRANVDGFLTLLVEARDAGVQRFVFASSSSIYGDDPRQPKLEENLGEPLSPYALTKAIDEQYARLFARLYGFHSIGLRYFNVFGPRQDPNGPYAAVIPRWITTLLAGQPCRIHGDGETSRDFCYVRNVVQANLLAATVQEGAALDRAYNIAVGERTTLNELYALLRDGLVALAPHLEDSIAREPIYGPFRAGDVRHSLADIGAAQAQLGYAPSFRTSDGLRRTLEWHLEQARTRVRGEHAQG